MSRHSRSRRVRSKSSPAGFRFGRKTRPRAHHPHQRRLRIEPLEDRRMLAVVTVDTALDVVDFNDGVTSLREALFATNLVSGNDTIEFDATLSGQTILLTQGELAITDSLSIDASSLAGGLTIDGDQSSRIFNINNNHDFTTIDVEIRGLTLTRGAMFGGDGGGAILSRENLTLIDSVITDSFALVNGGGIYAKDGTTTIIHSTISSNSSLAFGGGIETLGPLTITDSAIADNSANFGGGGISTNGTTTITDSTISGNSADAGGGILASGMLEITGSTISGNSADSGGGIWTQSPTTITDSTISGNSADAGGGIGVVAGTTTVTSSTFSGNSASSNGGGIWVSGLATYGTVTITGSTFSGNSAGFDGGGIFARFSTPTITNSTISGNSAGDNGGGLYALAENGETTLITDSAISGNSAGDEGGGLWATGSLAITGSTISENTTTGGSGGGIWADSRFGTTIITGSTIAENSSTYDDGGGIYARGTTTITESTISENSASRDGGGVWVSTTTSKNGFLGDGLDPADAIYGTTTITDSTISGNSAGEEGGGLRARTGNYGTTSITNSTISGNSADQFGGGVRVDTSSLGGETTIAHSTIVRNSAEGGLESGFFKSGGGIFFSGGNAAELSHTIVAENTSGVGNAAAPDVFVDLPNFAVPVNVHHSLIGDNTNSGLTEAPVGAPDANGNLIGGPTNGVIDPLLGPLADNGGPTFTHALLEGSPAINAGDLNAVAGAGDVPEFDQRGTPFGRVFSGRIDIGAFEQQEFSDLNLLVDTLDDESDGDFSRGDLSLREAIELANASESVDTIRFDTALSGGTILLTMGELAITDDVTIDGLGADLLTIDASGNDPTPDENNGDGSRIFNINDSDSLTNIDVEIRSLTLTGGDSLGFGGAIFSQENLAVINSTISGNSARSAGGIVTFFSTITTITGSTISGNSAGYDGGGIFAIGETNITESTISDNSAGDDGGGIFASFRVPMTITGSTISGNSASSRGGGIWAHDGTTTITDSTFSDNSANDGGSIFALYGTTTIASSTISNNSADRGGGIWARGGITTISESTISGNSAGFDGGGIFAGFSTPTITNSTISGNSAYQDGGGIFANFSSPTITNSTISGNTADNNGGGLYIDGKNGISTIAHSTIVGNVSDADISGNGSGGGLFVSFGTLTVDHTIVAQNFDNTSIGPDITGFLGVVLDVHFSLIGKNTGTGLAYAPVGSPDANGNLIGGSIGINPLLGPLADNGGPTFTRALLEGSPAIDAGDLNAIAGVDEVPEFDQRGTPFGRVAGGRIDIGAFEAKPVALPSADFNADGVVDGIDFLAWQRGYGMTSGATAADGDANYDGAVDSDDMHVWESQFGTVVAAQTAAVVAVVGDDTARIGGDAVNPSTGPLLLGRQNEAALVDLAVAVHLADDAAAVANFSARPPLENGNAGAAVAEGARAQVFDRWDGLRQRDSDFSDPSDAVRSLVEERAHENASGEDGEIFAVWDDALASERF